MRVPQLRTNKKLIAIFGGSIIICVLILLVLRCFFQPDKNWLSFWGTFIGSIIAALATFIAFYFTYSANIATQTEMNEQSRIEILPFLNVLKYESLNEPGRNLGRIQFEPQIIRVDLDFNKPADALLNLRIQNIGKATAVNIKLQYNRCSTNVLANLPCGEAVYLFFYAKIHDPTPFELNLIFSDLDGRNYKQTFKVSPHMHSFTDTAETDIGIISPPTLNQSFV